MNNDGPRAQRNGIILAAAGIVLLALIVVLTQVRANRTAIVEAANALKAQSDTLASVRAENGDLRTLTNPKVILLIGDGMDDQQITIARTYLKGSDGRLNLDNMPHRGVAQVRAVSEGNPDLPVYLSDSANAATSMASGVLTSPRRIATAAGTDEDIPTIMEMASAAGIGTGIVTTASITDATPASFVAHINDRLCHVPVDMVKTDSEFPYNNRDCSADGITNDGPGSIAEQIAESAMTVMLGGGSGLFDHTSERDPNRSIADIARQNGFEIFDELDDFEELDVSSRALGFFAPYDMPPRLRSVGDAEVKPVQWDSGKPVAPKTLSCENNRRARRLPTLAEMTRAAITSLDKHDRFMLMVESASIDKESHRRQPCGHLGEVGQLDDAVRVALDYAETHPEVLILVTADHGQAAHIIPEVSRWASVGNASPGHFARLLTPEGAVLGINYATNNAVREEHTGVQVPVYAAGFGAERLPTFMYQTDIFHLSARHLGLEN